MSETRIGISGWNYPPWRKVFYPSGLAHRRELEFASRQVNTIEINGSFYSLQRPTSYQRWYDETPDDFIFAVKANRYITHIRRLKDVEKPMANFFASGVLALEKKLGPILWQCPPSLKFDAENLEAFFKLLPTDIKQAARLARKHDERVDERSYAPTTKGGAAAMHHALEVRHASFNDDEFFRLLRKYNVAVVMADTAGKWPFFEEATADFLYARLHGDTALYESGYTPKALDAWAKRLKKMRKPAKDVYVYFDNDIKVRAPFDAVALAKRMIKGYEPEQPMHFGKVRGLRTPGPRLKRSSADSRWRRQPESTANS